MSPTVKRPFEDVSWPVGKAPKLDSNLVFKELEAVEVKIAKTNSVIASVKAGLGKCELDTQVGRITVRPGEHCGNANLLLISAH